jgi:hypothetical protein
VIEMSFCAYTSPHSGMISRAGAFIAHSTSALDVGRGPGLPEAAS